MKKTYQAIKYLCWDFCSAMLAWVCFYYFSSIVFHENIQNQPYYTVFLVGVLWVLIYSFAGFYNEVLQKSRIKEFFLILYLSIIGAAIVFLLLFLTHAWPNTHFPIYSYLLLYMGIHASLGIVTKMIVMSFSKYQIRQKTIFYNSLLIGSNQTALAIYNELETKNSYLGLKFLAYIHVGEENLNYLAGRIKHLGGIDNIDKIIRRCKIEQIVIAIEPSEHQQIAQILTKLEGINVKISIIPDMYQMLIGSVSISHVLGMPLIEIKQNLLPDWQKFVKRTTDILVSLAVLLIGFPFFVVIAIITKLSSKGPIFYTQIRIGRYAKPFKIFKFRSMFNDISNQSHALSKDNDPRITPWGNFMRKTRLDEMPQFYNVLIGNMSLVGPRPEQQYYVDQIMTIAPHYKHLHKVKPGITSLGQVKYGYAENVEEMIERLQYDIIYIENMSLLMDVRILIHTVLTVISAKGK
jgi:exopolysaccharide biosynthesis polyprenyl glycosylphosphotransferase